MKWRFFRHLHGGDDPDAERVYRWHIEKRSGARFAAGLATDKWKRSVDDYVTSAEWLLDFMDRNDFKFWPEGVVPLDPDGELLDGAHRVACALAIGLPVWVMNLPQRVWAPPWDWAWFIAAGISEADADRLRADWDAMHGRTA